MSIHSCPASADIESVDGLAEPDAGTELDRRHAAFFHELDAWTEYWDIYHPETRGRFYFGDGTVPGLLNRLLPRDGRPPVFVAWTRMALGGAPESAFAEAVRAPATAEAAAEVDALLARIFAAHFGDPNDANVRDDYLHAIFRFATNRLPPARERDARIADDDPRKSTAGRHRLEGDLMWFAWALVLEAAQLLVGADVGDARRSLMLAGIASGCPSDFAWRGHRRTRPEYRADDATAALLRERGIAWAGDFAGAAREVHALFRIREWGSE
jgi:hypothetical protein